MTARSETEQGLDALVGTRVDAPTSVLVIDDEEGVREVLSTWVEVDGCHPLPAASAEEALELAGACRVGIALCDVQMPGRDGFWFLEQVEQRHPDMAVVLVTGVHDVDWALRGLQHGVVDYLLKPFDQRSLSRALENAVRQHRLRRADRLLREQRASELGARHARLVQAMTRLHVVNTEQVEAALDPWPSAATSGASTVTGCGISPSPSPGRVGSLPARSTPLGRRRCCTNSVGSSCPTAS